MGGRCIVVSGAGVVSAGAGAGDGIVGEVGRRGRHGSRGAVIGPAAGGGAFATGIAPLGVIPSSSVRVRRDSLGRAHWMRAWIRISVSV